MYTSYAEHINLLSREQKGDLLSAIMAYAVTGSESDVDMDGMTRMAFSFIKAQMDRDNEKYQKTTEARREAGKKGGEAKRANATKKVAKVANANFAKQDVANLADNDNVNDNVTDSDKDNNVVPVQPHKCGEASEEYPYKEVVEYLNIRAGTKYRASSKDTKKHIHARFEEGYTLDDFKAVIDKKVSEWGKEPDKGQKDMRPYLRPSTLFGKNFESYLNQPEVKFKQPKSGFTKFPQREYSKQDYAAIEKALLQKGAL